jgi:hypothetical protein
LFPRFGFAGKDMTSYGQYISNISSYINTSKVFSEEIRANISFKGGKKN